MTRSERYASDLTQLARASWPEAKVVLVEGDIVLLKADSGPSIDSIVLAANHDWWAAKAALETLQRPGARASAALFHTLR